MKFKKISLISLVAAAVAGPAFSQINMLNTSNVPFAHMGESVAQNGGYSLLGAYEDGTVTAQGQKGYEGAVYLYNNGVLERTYLLTDAANKTAFTGRSVTLNSNFLAAAVSSPTYTGPNLVRPDVYIAGKVNGAWSTTYNYSISDSEIIPAAGNQVALDGYGTLAIGVQDQLINGVTTGAVFIYEFNGSAWVKKQTLTNGIANGKFGFSIAFHNDKLIVGAPESEGGRVYTYKKNGTWSQLNVFPSVAGSLPGIGYKVDVTDNSAIAASTGTAYFLELQNNQWTVAGQVSNISVSSVAIENVKAVIGHGASGSYGPDAASIYMKEWNGWNLKKTKTSTEAGDNFGFDVDIEGSKVLVSRKYADKGTITNVGAAVLYDFWSVIYSREAEATTEEISVNNLFPNPAADEVVTYAAADEVVSVEAIGQDGAISKLSVEENRINISTLAPGLYTLRIKTANGIESKKLSVL
jgi:hypothetical protein